MNDLSVSRCHAQVSVEKGELVLKDLKSRNGTFVDGERVNEASLAPGKALRFGNSHFLVVTQDQPGANDQISDISTCIVNPPPPGKPAIFGQLSEAQQRVLELLLDGKSEKEVAASLDISQHTVHTHVKGIYKKVNVNSRSELLAKFVSDNPRNV